MIFKGFVVLIWFVIAYMMVSVAIGLLAAKRVHNVKDYAIASRNLPLPIVIATVFATWFGAEVVFGVSATFVQEGFNGLAADPFGASMCLIIAGLFFSTKLYKLNIITLGDFYRIRYNRTVELLTTIAIVISYLGWVAAQISAMGLIFNIVTHGGVESTTWYVGWDNHCINLHDFRRNASYRNTRFCTDDCYYRRLALHR